MTPADLSRLESLAREATPGEWTSDSRYPSFVTDPEGNDIAQAQSPIVGSDYMQSDRDGAYIAAANPAAVLALIEENQRLREKLWKAPKVIAASDQEWPAGCHDIISCQKRRVCGYHQCIHTGKGAFLGAEIDAAVSDARNKP